MMKFFYFILGLLVLAFVGFIGRVTLLGQDKNYYDASTAIIVFTGEAARIDKGIELLSNERGKKLLISGVHRTTRAEDLVKIHPDLSHFINCCVILDYNAYNTKTNAVNSARWLTSQKINTAILVTSSYHMPRAHFLLSKQLPKETKIWAYTVSSDNASKHIFSEALKYWYVVFEYYFSFLTKKAEQSAL